MSEVVIKVDNLSKRYQLGERESYQALRDILARSMSAPLQKLFGNKGKTQKRLGRLPPMGIERRFL